MSRRALIPFLLLLLLLAACSRTPVPRPPAGLLAAAGPDYLQLAWTHPYGSTVYAIEERGAEAGGDWHRVERPDIDAEARTALLPLPEAGVPTEYRVGAWQFGELHFSDASPAVMRGDGITLQAGTLNRGSWSQTAGTALVLWFHLPEEAVTPFAVTVSAPSGAELVAEDGHLPPESGFLAWPLYDPDLEEGTYIATVTDADGNVWTHGSEVQGSGFRLSRPEALRLSALAGGKLEARWEQPEAGAWALAGIVEADDYVVTTDGSARFSAVAGVSELTLEVTVSNLIPPAPGARVIMPLPLGMANDSASFSP